MYLNKEQKKREHVSSPSVAERPVLKRVKKEAPTVNELIRGLEKN